MNLLLGRCTDLAIDSFSLSPALLPVDKVQDPIDCWVSKNGPIGVKSLIKLGNFLRSCCADRCMIDGEIRHNGYHSDYHIERAAKCIDVHCFFGVFRAMKLSSLGWVAAIGVKYELLLDPVVCSFAFTPTETS